jgi:hypothetical protein
MNLLGSGNAATKTLGMSGRATDGLPLLVLPELEWQRGDNPGLPVTYRLSELRQHPSYVRLRLTVPAAKLSALAEQGGRAFREPLVITRERIVIDGYARLELARLMGRLVLPCIEYELTEDEALRWLLQRHRRSNGMNDFCRILLALDLEPWLKEKARSNQRGGGQNKGSSKLTEAERLDVRTEIAAAAGVSVGNVGKVKQLTTTAQPELLHALLSGEVSIHRAWGWSKELPDKQREVLSFYQSERGIKKTIRTLVRQHRAKTSPTVTDLNYLIKQLSALDSRKFHPVSVVLIKAPMRAVFMTEELFRAFGAS